MAGVLPSSAQFGAAARVVVSSTPFGSDGLFSELFQKASSGELADACAVHATTEQANPTIHRAFLDAERVRDPDGFLSEYEARSSVASLRLRPARIRARCR